MSNRFVFAESKRLLALKVPRPPACRQRTAAPLEQRPGATHRQPTCPPSRSLGLRRRQSRRAASHLTLTEAISARVPPFYAFQQVMRHDPSILQAGDAIEGLGVAQIRGRAFAARLRRAGPPVLAAALLAAAAAAYLGPEGVAFMMIADW